MSGVVRRRFAAQVDVILEDDPCVKSALVQVLVVFGRLVVLEYAVEVADAVNLVVQIVKVLDIITQAVSVSFSSNCDLVETL